METILLKIDKKENVTFLKKLLKKLNFVVEVVDQEIDLKKDKVEELPLEEAKSTPSIDDFAGLWKDRDFTLETLREKAWKRS
jgi:hypothetical protein